MKVTPPKHLTQKLSEQWQLFFSKPTKTRADACALHDLLAAYPDYAAHLWYQYAKWSLTDGYIEEYYFSLSTLTQLTVATPLSFGLIERLHEIAHFSFQNTTRNCNSIEPSDTNILLCLSPSLLTDTHCLIFEKLIANSKQFRSSFNIAIDSASPPWSESIQRSLDNIISMCSDSQMVSVDEPQAATDSLAAFAKDKNISELWFHCSHMNYLWHSIKLAIPLRTVDFLSGLSGIPVLSDKIVTPNPTLYSSKHITNFPLCIPSTKYDSDNTKTFTPVTTIGIITSPENLFTHDHPAFFERLREQFSGARTIIPVTMWPSSGSFTKSIFKDLKFEPVSDETFLSDTQLLVCLGSIPTPHLLPAFSDKKTPTIWLTERLDINTSENNNWLASTICEPDSINISNNPELLLQLAHSGGRNSLVLNLIRNDDAFDQLVRALFKTTKPGQDSSHLFERFDYVADMDLSTVDNSGTTETLSTPSTPEPNDPNPQNPTDPVLDSVHKMIDEAIHLLQNNKLHRALSTLKEAEILHSNVRDLHYTLALCYISLNDLHSALKVLDEECELFPENESAQELRQELLNEIKSFNQ